MASDADTPATTRQRLLEAAFEVFAEKGYAGTRVQEIARRAGFTTGAIYANFNGKAALLGEAIGSQGLSALTTMMASGVGKGGNAGQLLRKIGVHNLVAETQPVDILLLDALAAAARDPEVAALVMPRMEAWTGVMHGMLQQARDRGDIDEAYSTEALVTLSIALALGSFVLRALDMPRPPADDVDVMMRQLVNAFAARHDAPAETPADHDR